MISKKEKLLSAYTETMLNGDFNPKSAIISKTTNTKKKFFKILTNNIIRDGLSQKTISRYCPFKEDTIVPPILRLSRIDFSLYWDWEEST